MKDKFQDIIGMPFIIYEEGDVPEYLITIGPSNLMALIDLEKYTKVAEWKPFTYIAPFGEGYVSYGEETFNVDFIDKAIQVLDPDEYAFYVDYIFEKDGDGNFLVLKKGKYAIVIAPAVKFEGNSTKPVVHIEDCVKKAPKSVNVL